MAQRFRNAWTAALQYPVTAGCIAVSVSLWLAVHTDQVLTGMDYSAKGFHTDFETADFQSTLERWGGVGLIFSSEPELYGPFGLWDGQWWRIVVSAFHHTSVLQHNWLYFFLGPLHIVLNVLTVWFLGVLLEPRMGSLRYLVFLLIACAVSSLSEFLLGNNAVGLSGFAYAQFGALMIYRKHDPEVAWHVSKEVVIAGVAWLFGCLLLTEFGIVPVANTAHFAGFGYGLLAGLVLAGQPAWRPWWGVVFAIVSLSVVPGFYYAAHPVWNGRYQWYAALREPDPLKKVARLERAVELDPTLRTPRLELASWYIFQRNWHRAWEMTLEVLRQDSFDAPSRGLLALLWTQFQTPQEQDWARKTLADTFKAQPNGASTIPPHIEMLLGAVVVGDGTQAAGESGTPPGRPDAAGGSAFRLQANPEPRRSPQVDPDAVDSAAEGVTL